MIEKLKNMLSASRFEHSMGVCETAQVLASRFGADVEKARLAGLLHDCAKNIPYQDMIVLCKQLGVVLDETELLNPVLIHAPLGAAMLEETFGITDADINNAVRYHTVGRAGMSTLEKIIYLADMIEPGRRYDGVEAIREKAERSLDEAMYEALKQSIIFNAQKDKIIHTGTVDAYNDILISERG